MEKVDVKLKSPAQDGQGLIKQQDKGTNYFAQLQKTQMEFFSSPKTMMQVAKSIGIDRANICWFVRDLRKAGAIWLVRKGPCPITRYPTVGFYTTNSKIVETQPKQLTLF